MDAGTDDSGRRGGDDPPPGVHVDQDMPFQRREWAAQRVGWAAAVLILAGALAGLFGNGPLSRAERRSEDGSLVVRHDRIVRHESPTRLRLSIAAGGGSEATVWISRSLAEHLDVEAVTPRPVRSWSTPERTGFVFAVPAGAAGRIEAVVRAKVGAVGPLRGEVGVEGSGAAAVRLSLMALP